MAKEKEDKSREPSQKEVTIEESIMPTLTMDPEVSLRNHFATAAMHGLMVGGKFTLPDFETDLVDRCFIIADAMVAKSYEEPK